MSETTVLEQLRAASARHETVYEADVSGLNLRRIDLTGLLTERLQARRTRLDYALLTGAQLVEADFTGANLTGAHLANVNAGLATFDFALMREVSLEHSIFVIGYCRNAGLDDADLTEAQLTGTLFFGSHFNRAVLHNVKSDDAGFNRVSMLSADLSGGSFVGATFTHADLTGANLSKADCSQADFREAKLQGVIWDGARLADAHFDSGVRPVTE